MHLETDAPFLRPKTAQTTRSYNEPANLPLVAQGIAELIGVSTEDVGARCSENSRRLFQLEAAAQNENGRLAHNERTSLG
jgi:TatD DNase family protein